MKDKALMLFILLLLLSLLGCPNIFEYQLQIVSFAFENVVSFNKVLDNIITVYVPADTDITKLKPVIVLATNELSVSPNSGVVQDFTNDVVYTVTSTNGLKREYKVHVEKVNTMLLKNLYISGQKSSNFNENNIYITMPYNTDLSSLQLNFETDNDVKANLESGKYYDFSNPKELKLMYKYTEIKYTIYVYVEKWALITNNPGFNANDGAGLLSFKNKLWHIGGWHGSPPYGPGCVNEIWCSEDNGYTWIRKNDAPWSGRHGAGWVVFNT